MKYLPNIDKINTSNYEFIYPPDNQPYKGIDLEIRVIIYNQFLSGQDKIPDFDV